MHPARMSNRSVSQVPQPSGLSPVVGLVVAIFAMIPPSTPIMATGFDLAPRDEDLSGVVILDDAPGGDAMALTEGHEAAPCLATESDLLPNGKPPGLLQWMQRVHHASDACWTGRADAVLMWRNAPYSRELVSQSGMPALNADQLESTLAAGPRIQLFRMNPCGQSLEVGYLRAFNFRSQRALDAATSAFLPTAIFPQANPQPLPFADATINLGSGIQTLELNGRTPMGFGLTQFIAGIRWLEWRESFAMNTNTPPPPVGPGTFDNYSSSVINSLYGGQLGIDTLLYSANWLRVESVLKGGAYYNTAAAHASYQSSTNPARAWDAYGIPSSGAFVGELGFVGVVPLHRRLDFRFGYLGYWLQSIAQPTRQLSNPAAVVSNGGTVIQGVTLGLEGRW